MAVEITETGTDDLTVARTRIARTILLEAALLGVLADGALRHAGDGLGWTLFVAALALAAMNITWRRELPITKEQVAWIVLAVACAAAHAWRDAEELRVFTLFGTLVSLALYSMAAAGLPAASILVARLRDVVAAGIYAFRDVVAGAPLLVARDADLLELPAIRGGASWTALRVLLITAPLVIVFTLLLSRADPVFASVFRLPAIDAEVLLSHFVPMGAFAWWSAGFIRGALLGVSSRGTLPERLPVRLGLAEVSISLGSVITLFAIFVALQLRWLFGGADVVLATTGLTVAEYARRGFFELVAVTGLVVPLVLGTRALIEDEKVMRRHRLLSLALIVLLGAIMASALLRMRLYVEYFGLTTDRLYATTLMLWLGVVAAAMARTVLGGWSRPFAAMTVLSGFAALFALGAVNPDQLVARVNLGRSTSEREVDWDYLSRLSGDAMPDVAQAVKVAKPSAGSCSAVRRLLERWPKRETSWNLGTWRGRQAVVSSLSASDEQRLCAGQPSVSESPGSNAPATTTPPR